METAPGTVLVVDDVEANRDLLSRRLQRQGHSVAVAENGQRALEMIRAQPFDLVLLDIMMPEMDGYETIRAIRELEPFRSLPIIALTAKAMKGDRQKCLEAGASDYLAKPVSSDQLQSMLRVWLSRHADQAIEGDGRQGAPETP